MSGGKNLVLWAILIVIAGTPPHQAPAQDGIAKALQQGPGGLVLLLSSLAPAALGPVRVDSLTLAVLVAVHGCMPHTTAALQAHSTARTHTRTMTTQRVGRRCRCCPPATPGRLLSSFAGALLLLLGLLQPGTHAASRGIRTQLPLLRQQQQEQQQARAGRSQGGLCGGKVPQNLRLPNVTHAGYVGVSGEKGDEIFTMFYEAQRDDIPLEERPIVVWLQVRGPALASRAAQHTSKSSLLVILASF